jgi:pectinesterase
MRGWFIILVFLWVGGYSQPVQPAYPRDTSFTVYSAWQKIRKEFPDAKPVFATESADVNVLRNITYRTTGTRNLCLDIFSPSAKSNQTKPAVLLIHGGGWRSGDRSQCDATAQRLAEAGYVAVPVEYRLSPEAKYPAGVYDLKEAVKFLKFFAKLYSIDTSRIAAMGWSAGATLAALLGTTGNHPLFDDPASAFPNISTQINSIVNCDGILDFTDPAESGKDNDPAKPSAGAYWFGGTFKEIPQKWIEASPLVYADGKTPAVLFVNSSQPRYHAGRDEFISKLKQFGTCSEVHTIENTPHTFWLFDPWFDPAMEYILAFLDKVF